MAYRSAGEVGQDAMRKHIAAERFAQQFGGSISDRFQQESIDQLRTWVSAICVSRGTPEFKATTKRELSDWLTFELRKIRDEIAKTLGKS